MKLLFDYASWAVCLEVLRNVFVIKLFKNYQKKPNQKQFSKKLNELKESDRNKKIKLLCCLTKNCLMIKDRSFLSSNVNTFPHPILHHCRKQVKIWFSLEYKTNLSLFSDDMGFPINTTLRRPWPLNRIRPPSSHLPRAPSYFMANWSYSAIYWHIWLSIWIQCLDLLAPVKFERGDIQRQ